MDNNILLTIALLLIGGYVVLYVSNRTYLEDFTSEEVWYQFVDDATTKKYYQSSKTGQSTWKYSADMKLVPAPELLRKNPPTSLEGYQSAPNTPNTPNTPLLPENNTRSDEYEVSAIFQNQGSRQSSKKQLNDAMSAYPLDWSAQGQASQVFQENQAMYVPKKIEAFSSADSTDMNLPDTAAMEEEEKKILQTYQPKSSKDLLQYSVDDVKTLIDKIYHKKGLTPVLAKSSQGDNVWEITEVKEKNPKIVWEEDPVIQTEVMRSRGESVIQVPHPATDLAAGLNPFANARLRVGNGKNDVTQWTPGLDRMFQPTHPGPKWQ